MTTLTPEGSSLTPSSLGCVCLATDTDRYRLRPLTETLHWLLYCTTSSYASVHFL